MELTTQPVGNRPNPADAPKPIPPRRLVVGIQSSDRHEVLTDTVRDIARQTRLPDLVVLSVSQEKDIDRNALTGLPFPIRVLVGPRGISAQRNRIIECLEPTDILLYLDDDFLMKSEYLEHTLDLFNRRPDIVLATGTVITDGMAGRAHNHAAGLELLRRHRTPDGPERLCEVYSGHGCNMAIRVRPVLRFGLRFDEALAPDNWLEDVEFSRQIAEYGDLVRSNRLCGVHLGSETSRAPGRRLGYSQIVNPVYERRMGTVSFGMAALLTVRNVLANVLCSLRPGDWTGGRGRLRGNLRAIADIARGRIDPQRATDY